MSEDGAKVLGKRLLEEVGVEHFTSIVQLLRELQPVTSKIRFAIPELDTLCPRGLDSTILELVSPPPAHHPSAAGKTSLLYLIIAQAILPATFSPSVALEGQNAAVVLFDPLNHFHVPRLVSVAIALVNTRLVAAGVPVDQTTNGKLKQVLTSSLCHLHIFRPQSWASLLVTLRSLPAYLFDQTRHKSLHRCVHSIILEDIDAFVWSMRNSASSVSQRASPLAAASTQLTTQLQKLITLLACAAILTSHSVAPSVFRPALPISWPHASLVTRLALQRVAIVRFAPTISIEQAESERQQRWEVVNRGRFECWKVGMGVHDGGQGFVFRVGTGVEIER